MFDEESHDIYLKYENSIHKKDEKKKDKLQYEKFLCQVPMYDPRDKEKDDPEHL